MRRQSRHSGDGGQTFWQGPFHWMWGFVRGFLSAPIGPTAEQRHEAEERWKHRWQQWVGRMIGPEGEEGTDFPASGNLQPLRDSLLGRQKGDVVAMLGPPPATSAQPVAVQSGTYWYADTWYYPLHRPRQHAIAVTFVEGVCSSVEHLVGPGA